MASSHYERYDALRSLLVLDQEQTDPFGTVTRMKEVLGPPRRSSFDRVRSDARAELDRLRRLLAQQARTDPTYGGQFDTRIPFLLMPVALETRFGPIRSGRRVLRIRILPDRIWIDRLQRGLLPEEREAGAEFHALVQSSRGRPDGEQRVERAWVALAQRFGTYRALYLAMETGDAGRVDDGGERHPPRAAFALPESFSARVYEASGRQLAEVFGAAVDPDIAFSLAQEEDVSPAGRGSIPPRLAWMADFRAAKAAGLGLEVLLPSGEVAPDRPLRVVVVGVRRGGGPGSPLPTQQVLEDLVLAHQYTHGTELLEVGQATNNTEHEDAARVLGADPLSVWRSFLKDRLGAPVRSSSGRPTALAGPDGRLLGAALGASDFWSNAVQGGGRDQQTAAGHMARLLWPATFGNFLRRVVKEDRDGRDGRTWHQKLFAALEWWSNGTAATKRPRLAAPSSTDLAALREHFVSWVRARGPFAPLRVGRTPYGILPVTSLDRARELVPEDVSEMLEALYRRFLVAAERTPHLSAVEPGDPWKQVYDILSTTATSSRLELAPVSLALDRRSSGSRRAGSPAGHEASPGGHEASPATRRGRETTGARGAPTPPRGKRRRDGEVRIGAYAGRRHLVRTPLAMRPPRSDEGGPLGPDVDLRDLIDSESRASGRPPKAGTLRWAYGPVSPARDDLSMAARGGLALRKLAGASNLQAMRALGRAGDAEPLLFHLARWSIFVTVLELSARLFGAKGGPPGGMPDRVAAAFPDTWDFEAQWKMLREGPLVVHYGRTPLRFRDVDDLFEHVWRAPGRATGKEQPIRRIEVRGRPLPAKDRQAAVALIRELEELRLAASSLASLPDGELTLLTAETLDLATNRFDAWLTSIVTRNLFESIPERPTEEPPVYLGAFGWVEALTPARRAPHTGGFVLTPSLQQAHTASVMRNAYLSDVEDRPDGDRDGGGSPFSVDLSSQQVRESLASFQAMLQGESLGERLGSRLERGLRARAPELQRLVPELRRRFPLDDPPEGHAADTESPEPLVLDGKKLLDAHAAAPAALEAALGLRRSETRAWRDEMTRLDRLLDAMKDLPLTEAVHQLGLGNDDRVVSASDLLSGRRLMAEFESIEGPAGAIRTEFSVVLPFQHEGEGVGSGWSDDSPLCIATGAPLNRWLASVLPGPDRLLVGTEAESVRLVSLRGLGLAPVDAVVLTAAPQASGETVLDRLVRLRNRAPEARVLYAQLGGSGGSLGVGEVRAVAAALLELLAAPEMDPSSTIPGADWSSLDDAELEHRIRGVLQRMEQDWQLCLDLVSDLSRREVDRSGLLGHADDLARLWAWVGAKAVPTAGFAPQEEPAAMQPALLQRGREALHEMEKRLREALGIQTDVVLTPAGLRRAVATYLAAPSGGEGRSVGIMLGRYRQSRGDGTPQDQRAAGAALLEEARRLFQVLFGRKLPVLPRFRLGRASTPPVDQPTYERWIHQSGRVHPLVGKWEEAVSLASLLRGDGFDPFTAFTVTQTSPPDEGASSEPWIGDSADTPLPESRASSVYLAPVAAGAAVSGLVLGRWPEYVPRAGQTAGLAYQYDRPGSEAPQALLLAFDGRKPRGRARPVPWTRNDLFTIVGEALELAKIRAVTLDELPPYGQLLPATFMDMELAADLLPVDSDESEPS